MKPPEEMWVRQAQSGDTLAFAQLVALHQDFVYNLALRGVGDSQEAEDVAQEAFLRAWGGLPRFRGQAQFRTWLYRIVVNLCYNRLPRLKQDLATVELDAAPEDGRALVLAEDNAAGSSLAAADPEYSLEAAERRSFIHGQVQHLPETQQMLLLLRYQRELSYEEIAEVMDMPLGTVKTGLFRAHAQLRKALSTWEVVV